MTDRVSCTIDGGIADVRLTRPEKRNAIDRAMLEAIIDAGERVAADRSVRVSCSRVRARGSARVSTGRCWRASPIADLRARRRATGTFTGSIRDEAVRAVMVLARPRRSRSSPRCTAPRSAAGSSSRSGADIRIVAPDAQLGVFEIRWGIVPDMCGTQLLPPLVGPDVAKELMFTSRLVTGDRSEGASGWRRGSPTTRGAAAFELAAEIAGRNPDAIKVIKRLVDLSWGMSLVDGLRAEHDLTEDIIGSANQVEAVRANLEQRPGDFAD